MTKGFKLLGFTIFAGSMLIVLSVLLTRETGPLAALSTAIYGVLVTLFLAAQIYGFVIAQTKYSENVESVKFSMLENELNDPETYSYEGHKA
jgi:hypothetical protein